LRCNGLLQLDSGMNPAQEAASSPARRVRMNASGVIQAGTAESRYGMPCRAAVGDGTDHDKRCDTAGMRAPA